MANIITEIRIVLSDALLFCPALSPRFYALYIAAGHGYSIGEATPFDLFPRTGHVESVVQLIRQ